MNLKFTAIFTFLLVAGSMIQTNAQQHDYGSKSYGIFIHHGWGGTAESQYGCAITPYPDGSYPQNVDETADNFDVQGFVDDIAAMKPEYLIFTAWHCWQHPLYPSDVLDSWLGEGHCSQRDVLQEILDACEAIDLDVYWYIQPSEAHNFTPEEQAAVGYVNRSTPTETYNDFLNELIAELTNRYKSQVKGFWFDKGLSYGCTDRPRIGETIRSIMPDAILIANTYANESADFGALETKSPTQTFENLGGYPNVSNFDENTWPAWERSVSFVSDQSWTATPGSIRYTSEQMYRYTVLQAGVNEEGGGVAWAMGTYADMSWNPGVRSGMIELGEKIDAVGESIKSTVPSDSWPKPEGTRLQELEWGIATRSVDGDFEYLHVLVAPSGNTLTIDAPEDGRVYTSAVNLRTGNACTFSQTSNQVNVTLDSSDSWDAVDTVIKLTADGGSSPNSGNIALNGTASQSSTDYTGIASRAIDDNTDGAWASGSVTHTSAEDNAWWEVDLGDENEIDEIVVFNRTDVAYMDRLSDFTVSVINDNGVTTFSQTISGTPTPSITVSAGCALGRTVRVQLNTTNTPLSLAEVEVYTCNPVVGATGVSVSPSSTSLTVGATRQVNANLLPANASNQDVTWETSDASIASVDSNGLVTALSNGTAIITGTTVDGGFTDDCTITVLYSGGNLALNGTASQSSTAYTGDASRAIDNNTDGVWSSGSVTHTSPEENPWWEVDLGGLYSIAEINIFGRTDACCAARLSDYTVSVINDDQTPFSANLTDFPEGSVSAGGVYGRIIRIQLNATNTALSLAEVQIFEGDGPVNPTVNTFTIQENEIGFCSVDGKISNNNLDYTGDGFANTSNALGNGVNWEIDGSAGSYNLTWRYASANSRAGDLFIDGTEVATNVVSVSSGSWSTWITESITVSLAAGVKTVRLEATTALGLGNIDYLEVTGPDAAASGCLDTAKFTSNKLVEENNSMFKIYPNPVENMVTIQLETTERADYEVLSISGQVMRSGVINNGTSVLDLSSLNSGFYLIKVTGASTSQIRKMIKN
ncbi:discoidin domain-containing protein [Tamlana agarivorans]|uniref:Discoidin domain-containing protein n=1 Tax=Pseudotamlana agarivorans TaxID=481183 RepID=A0ACC5U8F4_9FLAO|nr:discoidin domain-containing protein [Tamlana agarivorans]MBU2950602.1 discoidin domain-containing protein [Tamlana agarivorans]